MRDYNVYPESKKNECEGDLFRRYERQLSNIILCAFVDAYTTHTHTHTQNSIINIFIYVFAIFIKEISSLLTFYSVHDRFVVCLMRFFSNVSFESNTIVHTGCRITCACVYVGEGGWEIGL